MKQSSSARVDPLVPAPGPVHPVEPAPSGPRLEPVPAPAPRGPSLELIVIASTIAMVLLVVGLLTASYVISTKQQFHEISTRYNEQLQAQARELGLTVSHTLSITSASALRDSNYAFLGEAVRQITRKNPNVLRVQILDPEGRVVADSDEQAQIGEISKRRPDREWTVATWRGRPMYEYQEPIDYGSSSGKGMVVLGYSLEPLQAQLRALDEARNVLLSKTSLRTIALGAICALCAGLVSVWQSRRITRPLGALSRTAAKLADGHLDARVQPARAVGREVKSLGVVFNHMADRLSYLLEDARMKAVLEREMSVARKVQEALLPSPDPLQVGPLRIAGRVSTAEACGGDWWLRSVQGDGRVVLGIGDVTGHGLSTALVASSATAGFAASLRMRAPQDLRAEEVISALNRTLHEVGRGEHQMSSALAVFDLRAGEIDFSGGAHPSAVVINRNDGQVGALTVRGPLLGAAPDSTFTSRRVALRPGDVIVWYTDGLIESENEQRTQYGSGGLVSCLKANLDLPAERLRDAVLEDVTRFRRNQPQLDDITVVVAEFTPSAP